MRFSTLLFLLAGMTAACAPKRVAPFTVESELRELRLPVVRSAEPIEGRPPLISVSARGEIRVNGEPAGDTTRIAKDGYWSAPELESKLVALRKSSPKEADSVLIAIDPAWPYMIFKKILFTANKSGYLRVQFAVRKEGSDLVQRLPLRKGGAGSRGVAIPIAGGNPVVMGSLDPATIDDVVKRHLPEIRYCYERELAKDADLGGNLVASFTIGPGGLVTSARTKSSTLAHEGVEGCVRARLLKLRFPKPDGGGVVNVSYPFLFAKGDGRLNDGSHSPD